MYGFLFKFLPAPAVILIFLQFTMKSVSTGPGIIFVHLISYSNPSGKTDEGKDCDSWFKDIIHDRCDIVFKICLRDVDVGKDGCNIGTISTLNNIFENSGRITFDRKIGFIPNPFNFSLRQMPQNVFMSINVSDDDIGGQEHVSTLDHTIALSLVENRDASNIQRIILSSKHSDMILKVYGECDEFYYGPGCNTYCKKSFDKKDGFYVCDKVGQKHCLIGWTGENCTVKDICNLENPCRGGSTCFMNGSHVQCECTDSLTGTYCDVPKRPCGTNPCSNGGLCILNTKITQSSVHSMCVCPRNFTGDLCADDVDECNAIPPICENGAQCHNTYGSYYCICKNHHWGVNCEKPPVYKVQGIDSAFFYKVSAQKAMDKLYVALLIVVALLILIILLMFLFYLKKCRQLTPGDRKVSASLGSVYSECHYDNDDDADEHDVGKKGEKEVLKDDENVNCYEYESQQYKTANCNKESLV